LLFVLYVEEYGVALIEGATASVLPTQPDWDTGPYQTAKGQRLGHPVIPRALSCAHFSPLIEQLLDLRMDVESFGISGEAFGNFPQFFRGHSRVNFVLRLVPSTPVVIPIPGQIAQRGFLRDAAGFLLCSFQFAPD